MLIAVCHSKESGWRKVDDLTTLSDLRSQADNLLWAEADVSTLSEDDILLISEEFSLDELAVEDAMNTRQRPKFETYDAHQFLVMHELDEVDGQLEALQIACFVGSQYVLVMHAGASRTLAEAKKRWSEMGPERNHPADLVHTLLDVEVDDYQETADRIEQEVEDLEELLLREPTAQHQRQLYSIKQRLGRLRRYVLPASRALEWAVDPSKEHPFSEDTARLFRDVDDHLLRIKDQVANVDSLADALLELSRGEQAAMINLQSRKLAAWASIFAVDTVVAGIYGMNFALVPNEGSIGGFWFAMALMAVASLGLYVYFKRREWL